MNCPPEKLDKKPTILVGGFRMVQYYSLSMKLINILPSLLLILFCSCTSQSNSELKILIGTYTSTQSKGIYCYNINIDNLKVEKLSETEIDNPSFLAVDQGSDIVYSVSEAGSLLSFVTSFRFNRNSGKLDIINSSKIAVGSCYITVDNKRGFVATANYGSGTTSVIPFTETGVLGDAVNYSYTGHGGNLVRQNMSHPHSIVFIDNPDKMLVSDLGTDNIYVYELNGDSFDFTKPDTIKTPPKTGPRHMTKNKKEDRLYIIGELSGEILSYKYSNGEFNLIQEILADTCFASGSADIHLSPDERFLYVSTRLKGDGIVVFKVNDDGILEKLGYQSTGKHPRNFAITPCGNYMFVACRDENHVEIYSIDKETGLITDTRRRIDVPMPVFVTFVKPV